MGHTAVYMYAKIAREFVAQAKAERAVTAGMRKERTSQCPAATVPSRSILDT